MDLWKSRFWPFWPFGFWFQFFKLVNSNGQELVLYISKYLVLASLVFVGRDDV